MKIHERIAQYECERDVYLRFQEGSVTKIREFVVPRLIEYDDQLLAIEMTIVLPPYILDFAKCYIDAPPDFSAEVLTEKRRESEEMFGDDWRQVKLALAQLEGMGIWYADPSLRNIQFE